MFLVVVLLLSLALREIEFWVFATRRWKSLGTVYITHNSPTALKVSSQKSKTHQVLRRQSLCNKNAVSYWTRTAQKAWRQEANAKCLSVFWGPASGESSDVQRLGKTEWPQLLEGPASVVRSLLGAQTKGLVQGLKGLTPVDTANEQFTPGNHHHLLVKASFFSDEFVASNWGIWCCLLNTTLIQNKLLQAACWSQHPKAAVVTGKVAAVLLFNDSSKDSFNLLVERSGFLMRKTHFYQRHPAAAKILWHLHWARNGEMKLVPFSPILRTTNQTACHGEQMRCQLCGI